MPIGGWSRRQYVRVGEIDENPARRRPMPRWLIRVGLALALLLVTVRRRHAEVASGP